MGEVSWRWDQRDPFLRNVLLDPSQTESWTNLEGRRRSEAKYDGARSHLGSAESGGLSIKSLVQAPGSRHRRIYSISFVSMLQSTLPLKKQTHYILMPNLIKYSVHRVDENS